jgi:predicted peroxiredoxin
MSDGSGKYVFVLQHHNPQFDLMPFSIGRTWLDDKGLDLAFYLMYDAVQLMHKDTIETLPDIKEAVDYLLSKGVPIYVCGFCSRACSLSAPQLYPGIGMGNRHVFYSLMTERQVVYY